MNYKKYSYLLAYIIKSYNYAISPIDKNAEKLVACCLLDLEMVCFFQIFFADQTNPLIQLLV